MSDTGARTVDTVILGGGLAGLSAAHFLERPWTLLEKSERVGGLIKTEVLRTPEGGACLFDPTGHWLHLRDPEIRARVLERWLPGRTVSIQRKAAIFSRGVFTAFVNRRLNLSPHQPASSIEGGTGKSPVVSIVDSEMFGCPSSSTWPVKRKVDSSAKSFMPETELNSVTIIR